MNKKKNDKQNCIVGAKIISLFTLQFFICLALCSCGGTALVLPAFENLTEITIQEYQGDTPIGIEVSTGFTYTYDSNNPGQTYFYNPRHNDWKQITNDKNIPPKDTSLLYRFTDTEGNITEVFLYGNDKYNYLELPGKGIWRQTTVNNGKRFPHQMEVYRDLEFTRCFAEPAVNGQLALLDTYNGAGKAVWVDISGESVDDWWDRYIPDEWKAERPEDVRYVIVRGLRSKTYSGYWYDPRTGEKVSDAYEITFSLAAYDLLTGEEVVFEDVLVDEDKIAEYLTGK